MNQSVRNRLLAGTFILFAARLVLSRIRTGPVLVADEIGLFLAVVVYGAWNPVRSSQHAVYPAGWESPQTAVEDAGGGPVAYDLDHYDTIGLYVVQWFLPDSKVLLFENEHEGPPARLVISDGGWSREHPSLQAKVLWRDPDPGRDQVLWRSGG